MPSRACVGGVGHIRWHARRQPCVDAIPTASLPTYLGVARAFGRALWGGERRRRGLTGVLVELVGMSSMDPSASVISHSAELEIAVALVMFGPSIHTRPP